MPREVRDLPLTEMNPLSLARTLPGVSHTIGSAPNAVGGSAIQFSINGQRVRGKQLFARRHRTTSRSPVWLSPSTLPKLSRRSPFKPGTSTSSSAAPEVVCSMWSRNREQTRYMEPCYGAINLSGSTRSRIQTSWKEFPSPFSATISMVSRWADRFVKTRPSFFGGLSAGHSPFQRELSLGGSNRCSRSPGCKTLFPFNPQLDLYLRFLGDLRGTAAPIELALGPGPCHRTGSRSSPICLRDRLPSLPNKDGPRGVHMDSTTIGQNPTLSRRATSMTPGSVHRTAPSPATGVCAFQDSSPNTLSRTRTSCWPTVILSHRASPMSSVLAYGRLRADDPIGSLAAVGSGGTDFAGVSSFPTSRRLV